MATVGIRELKEHTKDILRQVQEQGQAVDIIYRGEVIARIVPVTRSAASIERTRAAIADLKQLAAEIGALNLPPTDVQVLMDQERR
jgi:antitoxin (DNA-binding transcriptional repressor) of toxin-antitoxin stability system